MSKVCSLKRQPFSRVKTWIIVHKTKMLPKPFMNREWYFKYHCRLCSHYALWCSTRAINAQIIEKKDKSAQPKLLNTNYEHQNSCSKMQSVNLSLDMINPCGAFRARLGLWKFIVLLCNHCHSTGCYGMNVLCVVMVTSAVIPG